MKKSLLVAALAVIMGSQAAHATDVGPLHGAAFVGNWVCTIGPTTKLFINIPGKYDAKLAFAALREYPYYGLTKYQVLRKTGSYVYMGSGSYLFMSARDGVLRGSGRIGGRVVRFTCSS